MKRWWTVFVLLCMVSGIFSSVNITRVKRGGNGYGGAGGNVQRQQGGFGDMKSKYGPQDQDGLQKGQVNGNGFGSGQIGYGQGVGDNRFNGQTGGDGFGSGQDSYGQTNGGNGRDSFGGRQNGYSQKGESQRGKNGLGDSGGRYDQMGEHGDSGQGGQGSMHGGDKYGQGLNGRQNIQTQGDGYGSQGGQGLQDGYEGQFGDGQPNFGRGVFGQGSEQGGSGPGSDGFSGRLEDSIPGIPGQDYPIETEVPVTSFKCNEHEHPGIYGDVEARCQVFHICQRDGRHDSFLCPVGTIFNQKYFVCDWWHNVKCEDTPNYYDLNANLYSEDFGIQDTGSGGQHGLRVSTGDGYGDQNYGQGQYGVGKMNGYGGNGQMSGTGAIYGGRGLNGAGRQGGRGGDGYTSGHGGEGMNEFGGEGGYGGKDGSSRQNGYGENMGVFGGKDRNGGRGMGESDGQYNGGGQIIPGGQNGYRRTRGQTGIDGLTGQGKYGGRGDNLGKSAGRNAHNLMNGISNGQGGSKNKYGNIQSQNMLTGNYRGNDRNVGSSGAKGGQDSFGGANENESTMYGAKSGEFTGYGKQNGGGINGNKSQGY